MKNVAGFDVSRLQTGALGTLGIITEVSLKCLPLPKAELTLVQRCSAADAIRRMNAWGGQPLPLSATCHYGGQLWVRLSGAPSAVDSATTTIGGEPFHDAERFWNGIRDHDHPFFLSARRDDRALWRLSVRSTAPYLDFDGEQLIEWGGALRWLVTDTDVDAARLRKWATSQGGHATRFRGGRHGDVFTPLDPTLAALHARLKNTFDPHGILNRGRLYAGF